MEIVIKLVSGLGNQLFQYAAGRYFAERHNAALRLIFDATQPALSHGTYPRPLLLDRFALPVAPGPMTAIDRLMMSARPGAGLARKMFAAEIYPQPFDQRFQFLPQLPIGQTSREMYLTGYWQSYLPAERVADVLRAELAFREPATGKTLDVLQQIEGTPNTISLHMRRGDYTLAAENNIALPLSYYRRAMAVFEQQFERPTYFVFSDDIAFAKKNLPAGARLSFVEHNDDFSAHEDLRLMSHCRHHILANSTFSWWGAWLNARQDKQVIAPRHWQLTADSYHPQLLPPAWTLLDSLREE